jgi:hypothetical protein
MTDELKVPPVSTEAESLPRITFKLGEVEHLVPAPFTAQTWWWILENCRQMIDPNEGETTPDASERFQQQLFQGIVVKAADILSVATGLKIAEVKTIEDLDRVRDEVVVQAGKEWADAAPFSSQSVRSGFMLMARSRKLLQALQGSDGGKPQSQSSPKSAAETGREPAA